MLERVVDLLAGDNGASTSKAIPGKAPGAITGAARAKPRAQERITKAVEAEANIAIK